MPYQLETQRANTFFSI